MLPRPPHAKQLQPEFHLPLHLLYQLSARHADLYGPQITGITPMALYILVVQMRVQVRRLMEPTPAGLAKAQNRWQQC